MGRPEQPEATEPELADGEPAGGLVTAEEDVLAGGASAIEPAEPGRPGGDRSRRWRRRSDYVALAIVVVVALVGALLVWWFSDERNTVSQTSTAPIVNLAPATQLPTSLNEAWQAPSSATVDPVALGSTVVTGDGGAVLGRDPLTGAVRWTYSRNWPLCEVTSAWGRVFAVFHKDTNCSEVSTLDPVTGERGPQRNGDGAMGTRVLTDGSYALLTGPRYAEVYRRDDLVKTLEWGQLRAIVNPGKQPRQGCTYGSFALSAGQVAVVERCPAVDPNDRLTVLKAAPDKSDEPQVTSSVVLPGSGARVVAVNGQRVAVALPNPGRLLVLDVATGSTQTEYPLDLPADDLKGDPAGLAAATSTTPSQILWYTGSRTMALSPLDLHPLWSVPDGVGTGTVFAGRTLVPVRGGIAVLDQVSGTRLGTLSVDRHGYVGPVSLNAVGPVVLEQRGGTLVALR